MDYLPLWNLQKAIKMDFMLYVITLLLSLDQVVNEPFPRRKLQPKFLPTPTNITVHRGETAALKCHIRNPGPKVVVWRKDGTDAPLTIGKEIFDQDKHMAIEVVKISEDEAKYELIIKDIQPKHSGTYLCQVTASKLYAHYVTLHVLDEPIRAKESLIIGGKQYVNQDDKIVISCNVTGATRAPDGLDWYFNGERIQPEKPRWKDRTTIVKWKEGKHFNSELTVERSRLQDFGTYVCRSSDLNVDSLRVNVLSATTSVKRRDHGNLAQADKSAAVSTFQMNNMLYTSSIVICFIITLTSKYITLYEPRYVKSSVTYLGKDYHSHR